MGGGSIDGTAVVLCEGNFAASDGKTAHGLVRHTERYKVLSVIDSHLAGRDAGEVLDARRTGIPIVRDLCDAIRSAGRQPDILVVGVATHGGVLPPGCRPVVSEALARGINVDSGLHELLGDDPEFAALAAQHRARIRDVRRTPPRELMHAFTGEIAAGGAGRAPVLVRHSPGSKRAAAVADVHGVKWARPPA